LSHSRTHQHLGYVSYVGWVGYVSLKNRLTDLTVLTVLALFVCVSTHAATYTTNFPATENPISEGGKWAGGQNAGGNLWGNLQTTPGLAFGVSEPTQFGDPTANLTGTWGATQSAAAVIKVNTTPTTCCHEVEVRLRSTITNGNINGYEVLCPVATNPGYGIQIVRWNGANGQYVYLNEGPAHQCKNGDVLMASASGTNPTTITVSLNGSVVLTGVDHGTETGPGGAAGPFTGGNPGIGVYDSGDSNWSAFGISSFTATDTSAPSGPPMFYVNNSGTPACSDSSTFGTAAKPWCTIGYAVGHISSGSTLQVRQGTYNENVTITGPAGSAAASTLIQAYPGDTVTLRGPGVDSGRIMITNTSYITFDGFKITNYNQGLFVESAHHITIKNTEISFVGQEGLNIHHDSSFVTVDNCSVHDTRQWQFNGEGIYIGTSSAGPDDHTNNVTIRNTTIFNTNDEGIELKPGTHDCLLEGNTLYNNMIDPSFSGAGSGAIEVNEATIGCPTCTSGIQTWPSNPNHVVRNNIVHSSKTGIRAGTGSLIYNNIVYATVSPYDGILADNNASDSYPRKIYHNTVDVPVARAIVTNGGTTDVRNNIGPSTPQNMATSDSFYVNKAAFDYHLKAGAPPVNIGADLRSTVPSDKDGTSRDTQPDIGAYEYAGGPPVLSACDLNGDSATNVSDVQLSVNQAVEAFACSTGDINKDGACNVIDVQRVVNAALGGTCVTP
jgi:parallel beta-helix repeat protein